MTIRVWGCRGSLPTPGPDTVRYGGNTTCIELRLSDGTVLIVDAGSGMKRLGQALVAEGVEEMYILLTHAHWDHLMGFPFFAPAYLPNRRLHVRGGPNAKDSLQKYLSAQMTAPYFPVEFSAIHAQFDFTQGEPQKRQMGSASVIPVPLSHPNGGYGFRIEDGDSTFVFLGDNELGQVIGQGLSLAGYVEAVRGADVLFHDAQYLPSEYAAKAGWGHSTTAQAIELAERAGVPRLGLFHHDPERTDEQLDAMAGEIRDELERRGSGLEAFVVAEGMVVEL